MSSPVPSEGEASNPTTAPSGVEQAAPPRRRLRRWVILLVGVGVLGLGGWLGGLQLWAWHHFRAAEQALHRYDFPEALAHLERCLRVWPNSVATRLQAAQAARRADLLERAEVYLTACEN